MGECSPIGGVALATQHTGLLRTYDSITFKS